MTTQNRSTTVVTLAASTMTQRKRFLTPFVIRRFTINATRFVAVAILLLAFVASPAKAELVSHWKLDDAVGANPVVDSKSGFDAAQVGSPVLGQPGVAGTSGRLSTGNNTFVAPANAAFNLDKFTFSVWFNPELNGGGGHNTIIANRDGENGFILYQVNDTVQFWLRKTAGGWQSQSQDIVRGVDQWYHIAGSFDASTGDKKFYVTLESEPNATLDNTLAGADVLLHASGPRFSIGSLGGGALPLKDGLVDDVQLYDTALSDADINTLFHNPGVAIGEIPEPSTLVLAALGLLGLLGFTRRRRRK